MKKTIIYLLILLSFGVKAQEKDKTLSKGNDEFASKNYVDAEADYRISQAKFSKKAVSSYNLGTTIYRENQAGEAKFQFARAIKDAKSKTEKHQAFHNLGNSLMLEKEYGGAVEAYKNALRNNPDDEQTRYNYALAKKMLKENPPKNDDKNKDKKKDQDKNKDNKGNDKNKDKDKKEGDKGKDKGDKKPDDKKDGKDKEDKGDGNKQPQPSGASKQRIQNLLDAVNNEEKKVQEKVKAQQVQGSPKKSDKDW